MSWKLWLDDQISDPETPARHTPEGWTGADSSDSAITLVRALGLPSHIDFDHDLGYFPGTTENDTAMLFLRWIEYSEHIDGDVPEYAIHSANPEGSKNIVSFMESWKKSKTLP